LCPTLGIELQPVGGRIVPQGVGDGATEVGQIGCVPRQGSRSPPKIAPALQYYTRLN
jgi:hypothetical protein